MKAAAKGFFLGARAPIEGIRLLFRVKGVFLLSIVPALVTSGFLVFGIYKGIEVVPMIITGLLGMFGITISGFFLQVAYWLTLFLGGLMYLLLTVASAFVLTKILLVPFNSLIAEKVLRHEGRLRSSNDRLSVWIKKSIVLMGVSVLQTLIFLVIGSVLFVTSFIPVLQVVSGFIGLIIIAFDCSDYSMELAELGIRRKFDLLKSRFLEFSGFGVVVGLTLFVPLLNLLFLPIAVAGASWMISRFDELWTS